MRATSTNCATKSPAFTPSSATTCAECMASSFSRACPLSLLATQPPLAALRARRPTRRRKTLPGLTCTLPPPPARSSRGTTPARGGLWRELGDYSLTSILPSLPPPGDLSAWPPVFELIIGTAVRASRAADPALQATAHVASPPRLPPLLDSLTHSLTHSPSLRSAARPRLSSRWRLCAWRADAKQCDGRARRQGPGREAE